MNQFRADLHCHTTFSDGTLTPEEIIKLASTIGLRGLSITDHDTIDAYPDAVPIAEQVGIALLPGIEFSASHRGKSVHILAYSFPWNSSVIHDFCQKHTQRRLLRNRGILQLLNKHGMSITEEELQPNLSQHGTIGRPHIALAMLKKGYVSSIQEAFSLYLGEGKPCYTPGGYFSVQETIDLIHKAQGLAIIAHPHLINDQTLIRDLLKMNFDGLEGYYARFPKVQQEKWVEIGRKKGWIITGGSDYHGEIKPMSALGTSWVCEETFQILYDHFKKSSV